MKTRLFALLLALVLTVCSACSSGHLEIGETETATATAATEEEALSYTGPAPDITVFSPGDTWDTVDPALWTFIGEARAKYVHGDTGFTVKTDEELNKKCNPVVFSVSVENSELFRELMAEISEDESFTDTLTVKLNRPGAATAYTGSTTLLKTGTTYYWRVVSPQKGGAKAVSEVQTLTTEPGPRILLVGGIANFRDLGGWPTSDGGTVKEGMVYRCAKVENATATDKKTVLNELKIKTELDLRNPESDTDAPVNSPFKASLNYVNISSYSYTYLEHPSTAASAVRVFTVPSNYPIVFHCAGGADRTGVLGFMLKALCGVDETDLVIDYELTPNRYRIGTEKFDFPAFYHAFMALPGGTVQEKAFLFYRDVCGLSEMEIVNIQKMLTDDTAVFTAPPKAAVKAEGGVAGYLLTPRASGDPAGIVTASGASLPFTFERGMLKVTVSGTDETAGKVTFADGSSLSLAWTAA